MEKISNLKAEQAHQCILCEKPFERIDRSLSRILVHREVRFSYDGEVRHQRYVGWACAQCATRLSNSQVVSESAISDGKGEVDPVPFVSPSDATIANFLRGKRAREIKEMADLHRKLSERAKRAGKESGILDQRQKAW